MIETRMVETAPGMVFDVSVEGKNDDTLVLMLHGFGVSRFYWNAQVHAVGQAGDLKFSICLPSERLDLENR